jgi:hypothetical protein
LAREVGESSTQKQQITFAPLRQRRCKVLFGSGWLKFERDSTGSLLTQPVAQIGGGAATIELQKSPVAAY